MNKHLIAKNFSKAAPSYAKTATLQHEVGNFLLDNLDYIQITPQSIIDIGCGVSPIIDNLANKYPQAKIYAMDIAFDMLLQSRLQNKANPYFFCADNINLPIKNNSIDLIVSNLMLQWCDNYPQFFSEVKRILKPNGIILFSTFGTSTLQELRQSWDDNHVHVNDFVDAPTLGNAMFNADLSDIIMDTDRLTLYYPTVKKLMQNLKDIGANNINDTRQKGLQGKNKFKQMLNNYEQMRTKQGLPVTYEIIYIQAKAGNLDSSFKNIPIVN
jgi:malonyl-CoA O-methyltransferase